MRIKLRIHEGPAHDRITVFIGPDLEHLACAGELTMRPEESRDFEYALAYGDPELVAERLPQP
jgi:hypothetical protein